MTTSTYPIGNHDRALERPRLAAIARVPGSKSLTNRALVVAALADGPSILTGALDCEDTQVMVDGAAAARHRRSSTTPAQPSITGQVAAAGPSLRRTASLFVANSGTSLRFLTAMLATGTGTFHLDGTPRMRQRPVSDLLAALNGLRRRATSDLGTGCPPVTIQASGLAGGDVFVRGDVSSQFLSGLLMALPYARDATTIEVQGVARLAAVRRHDAGRDGIVRRHGQQPQVPPLRRPARRITRAANTSIEPDASAASYFFALAALTGGYDHRRGPGTTSIQGDMAFVDVLEHMGCTVEREPDADDRHRRSAPRG